MSRICFCAKCINGSGSHFNGKEKDPLRLYLQSGELCRARLTSPPDLLTSYSDFGARYLEHDLMTGWLSVDPMSDKYPSISPYAYCAWNPLKLVDPDGKEIGDYYSVTGRYLGWDGVLDNKVHIMDNKTPLAKDGNGNIIRVKQPHWYQPHMKHLRQQWAFLIEQRRMEEVPKQIMKGL